MKKSLAFSVPIVIYVKKRRPFALSLGLVLGGLVLFSFVSSPSSAVTGSSTGEAELGTP